MPDKKVRYNDLVWDEEEGPSGFVRLVRWLTKDDVRFIEDLVEIDVNVYGEFLKKRQVVYITNGTGENTMATKKKEALPGLSISGEHLAGKVVILREDYFKPEYRHIDRRFKCSGGFGCDPNKMGTAVFGTFLADGEEARVSRGDILCFAPAEQAQAVSAS